MDTCPDLRDLVTLIMVYPGEMEIGISSLLFLMGKTKSGEVGVFLRN